MNRPTMPKKSVLSYVYMLALAAIVAAAFTGCGSLAGSSGGGEGGAASAVQNPLAEAEGGSQASQHYIVKSSDPIYPRKGPSVVSYPTGMDNDEVSETGAEPVEPCSLVSHRRAAAILGGSVRVSQEPQGPTCVYAMRGSAKQVTLVVESTRLASLRKHARKADPVRVAGHTGWCLHYESSSIAVPLAGGRVLHAMGPCAEAARFAALALPRVPR